MERLLLPALCRQFLLQITSHGGVGFGLEKLFGLSGVVGHFFVVKVRPDKLRKRAVLLGDVRILGAITDDCRIGELLLELPVSSEMIFENLEHSETLDS